jgi:hypothetical protein
MYKNVLSEVDQLKERLSAIEKQDKTDDDRIESLLKEIERLKTENYQLQSRKLTVETLGNVENIVSGVSKDVIHQYVHELLKNEAMNMTLVPDKVEGALYETVFSVILNLLNKTAQSNAFMILGHKLRIVLEPGELVTE